jgi:surface protein
MRRVLAKSLGAGIEERFIISVKTDNAGTSADNQFTLPWTGTYDVDWGDGTTETSVTDEQTHTYGTSGTYDIKVTATSGRVLFNNGGDKEKLTDIINWGSCEWSTFIAAFKGCESLTTITATDLPNLTSVLSFLAAFNLCKLLTANNTWANWDTSNATDLSYMFERAEDFNIDISDWDVSNVTNMRNMFFYAKDFNQPVGKWNTANVTNVQAMFRGASDFEQSLADWDITSITNMIILFSQASISTANYDATLISWAAQNAQNNVQPNFGGSKYTLGGAAEAARNTLINTYGWTITDGGGI